MLITEKYFFEEPQSSVIGPQLGALFATSGIRITIGLPDLEIDNLICKIFDETGILVVESTSEIKNHIFKHFIFSFSTLEPNKKYFYKFILHNGDPLNLEGGLTYNDCFFYAPTFDNKDKVALLSCNNPFHSKKDGDKRFTMWERLHTVIQADHSIKLLIQGGDQVYHDDIEADCLQKLRGPSPDISGVQKNIIRNYQHYYSNLNYRKILARTPSIAMLDDHDITDGWGGRPESFDQDHFKKEWQDFFDIAYDAFKAYQTAKNPEHKIYKEAETTFLDFGNNRIYLLDLRKEKNVKDQKAPLLSLQHENNLFKSLEETPNTIKNVIVLSPVVPVRINPSVEDTLGVFSKALYQLRANAKIKMRSADKLAWLWTIVHKMAGLGGVADLTDDLQDGLSSSLNRPFLGRLLHALGNLSESKGKNAYILSGDIHTGGISEIFVKSSTSTLCIPQIVSSPIGYAPMAKIAKDKTTEEMDFKIQIDEIDNITVMARNIFYRSDRNFAILQPSDNKQNAVVEFYFEGLALPIKSPASFTD